MLKNQIKQDGIGLFTDDEAQEIYKIRKDEIREQELQRRQKEKYVRFCKAHSKNTQNGYDQNEFNNQSKFIMFLKNSHFYHNSKSVREEVKNDEINNRRVCLNGR